VVAARIENLKAGTFEEIIHSGILVSQDLGRPGASLGREKLRNWETRNSSMASEVDGWYSIGAVLLESAPLAAGRLRTIDLTGRSLSRKEEEVDPSGGL
jgi:hypothetical protein